MKRELPSPSPSPSPSRACNSKQTKCPSLSHNIPPSRSTLQCLNHSNTTYAIRCTTARVPTPTDSEHQSYIFDATLFFLFLLLLLLLLCSNPLITIPNPQGLLLASFSRWCRCWSL